MACCWRAFRQCLSLLPRRRSRIRASDNESAIPRQLGTVPRSLHLGSTENMRAPEISRAVAAATAITASLDLIADDAVVLHNSNKLALRLLPCDVFARVAPAAQHVAQFEIDLARRLAESKSPVAALEPRVEPRVYERDGF